VKLSQVETRPP